MRHTMSQSVNFQLFKNVTLSLLMGLYSCSFLSAQNAFTFGCDGYSVSASTGTLPLVSQDPTEVCAIMPLSDGIVGWTGSSLGFPLIFDGFITYTFDIPQTDVSVWFTVVDIDDTGQLSVNGGGTASFTVLDGCANLNGNVLGPYTGDLVPGGNFGDVLVNVQSTQPFTEVTLVNTGNNSGFVTGACNSVMINNPCVLNLGPDTTLCEGETLILDATLDGASYVWQDGSTANTFLVSEPGTYTVELNATGCLITDTINISYNPIPIIDLGLDTTLCQGDSIVLNTNLLDGNFLWQDGSTESTFTVVESGIYSVEVEVNNCVAMDSLSINFNSLEPANLGPDTTLCEGETLNLNAIQENASYLWQDNSTASTFLVSAEGNYSVEVTSGVCSFTDNINVGYSPLPLLDLGNDTTLCQGSSLVLEANVEEGTYSWQDGSTEPTFTVVESGIYTVEVEVNNCNALDSLSVNYELVEVNLGEDITLCSEETLELNVFTPEFNYVWQDNSTAPTFTVTEPGGVYSVMISSPEGCSDSDTIAVSYDSINLDLGGDRTLCSGDSLIINPTDSLPGAFYLWQDGTTTSSFIAFNEGLYTLNVLLNNCEAENSITLTVEECLLDSSLVVIDIPNVFTPNSDGLNDLFTVTENTLGIAFIKTTIYNRWGTVVYETENPLINWNGNNVVDGVYFWVVEYEDVFGRNDDLHGTVTVLR